MQNHQRTFGKRGLKKPNVQSKPEDEWDFAEIIWSVAGTIHALISLLFNRYVVIIFVMFCLGAIYIRAQVSHERYLDSIDYVALIRESDDYTKHGELFANITRELIDKGKCTPGDFAGTNRALPWLMSTAEWNKRGSVYFVHCGGNTMFDLIYLNVGNGRPFRWIVPLNPNSTTLPFPHYFLE